MKATEAKPLDAAELETLRSLMQRWVLCNYPAYGSEEQAKALDTYRDVVKDAKAGKIRHYPETERDKRSAQEEIRQWGETDI